MLVLKDVLRPRLKPVSSGGEEFQPDKCLTDRIKSISKSSIFTEILLNLIYSQSFSSATNLKFAEIYKRYFVL